MSQRMRCDWFGIPAPSMRLPAGLLYGAPSDVASGDIAREKPLFGPVQTPPVAQDFQQLCREHHIAILLAFALFDSDHHALAINISGFNLKTRMEGPKIAS